MKNKVKAIEQELNSRYLERRDEVRGLLVSLLSKNHILLLGAPGTGKSAMTEDLCRRIGGQYFKKLVSRTTTPEELFGPVSLKALENDSYHRVTKGKLPEAEIAFIDELWKCNSAVLNGMLGILNEREYENNGNSLQCPLQFCVGASNELPEDREELGALWDRFMLRYVVRYIRDARNFELLLSDVSPGTSTTLTRDELTMAQKEVENVSVAKVIHQYHSMRQKMLERNIAVSDRRWKQTLSLVKANAWMEGRTEASDDDLEILAHALWQEPGQIKDVRHEIMMLSNPLDKETQDRLDEATEVYNNAINAPEDKQTALGTEANTKLKAIGRKLEELKKQALDTGKSDTRITEALDTVRTWNGEVLKKCLGITLPEV